MRRYRILLTPDDNGTFLVTCPALPEVTTFGDTEIACERHARAAIEEALAARIARGVSIPLSDVAETAPAGSSVRVIDLPALIDVKVELYAALERAGLTRAELGRRLDWKRTSVDRVFQLGHASRFDQLEAAAAALGLAVKAEVVARTPTEAATTPVEDRARDRRRRPS